MAAPQNFLPWLLDLRGVTYDALHLFVNPTTGYRLSDNIWRTDQKTRNRIDQLLAYEIRQGTAAVDIADLLERYTWNERRPIRTKKPYGKWGSYDARRLARTEITAAHGRATMAAANQNPYVVGIGWRLSWGREDWNCNCEANSKADPAGLGEGVYPKDNVPTYPDHPHDVCTLTPEVGANAAEVTAQIRDSLGAGTVREDYPSLFNAGGVLSLLLLWGMRT